jgi:hypothetical protein
MHGAILPFPQYAFMAWRSIKSTGTTTFIRGCTSVFFCVVLSCANINLAMGRSPVQGVLSKCLIDLEFQYLILNQNRPEDLSVDCTRNCIYKMKFH